MPPSSRYYETLDKKVQEDAAIIEELRKTETASRAAAEEEKTRLRRLEARLNEALDKIESLEQKEAAARATTQKQAAQLLELEAQLNESASKLAAAAQRERALQEEHDEEIARMKAAESKLKAAAAAERQKLLEAQEEMLELERLKKLVPPKKTGPPPGDVDVRVEEDKGRMRVVVIRKKAGHDVVVE